MVCMKRSAITLPASTFGTLAGLLAATLLFSQPSYAQSQDQEAARIENLPVDIGTVETGGEWQNGDKTGFYRIVVTGDGIEHLVNRLYVQWLALEFGGNSYRLERTVAVEEINTLNAAISVETEFYNHDHPQLIISTTDREMKTRAYRLTLLPDGRYRLD